jgi:transcriptional regulator with XRE-family HTH domain
MVIMLIMELHREKIKIELERLGWTEAELAKRMGVHRQYLNRIMVGDIGISLKGIDRIANALGLTGKDLIR